MKKKIPINSEEIDLIEILKTLWEGKLKILLVTSFFFLITFALTKTQPDVFETSIKIKVSKETEFKQILLVERLLNPEQEKDKKKKFNIQVDMLNKFVDEIMDYEEIMSILKTNKKIEKNIIDQNQKTKRQILFDNAKSFSIKQNKDENIKVATLKFYWDDPSESIDIIDEVLKASLLNLEKRVINELTNKLMINKNLKINKDVKRLEYLLEQSKIAKELDLKENQVDSINLSQTNVSLNINNNDVAYYLRGSKAIDKEISLIRNRKYVSFLDIEKLINSIKDNKIKWVDYNIYLAESKPIKDSKLLLMISIVSGLIIGVFYVLISHAIKSRKLSSIN